MPLLARAGPKRGKYRDDGLLWLLWPKLRALDSRVVLVVLNLTIFLFFCISGVPMCSSGANAGRPVRELKVEDALQYLDQVRSPIFAGW